MGVGLVVERNELKGKGNMNIKRERKLDGKRSEGIGRG